MSQDSSNYTRDSLSKDLIIHWCGLMREFKFLRSQIIKKEYPPKHCTSFDNYYKWKKHHKTELKSLKNEFPRSPLSILAKLVETIYEFIESCLDKKDPSQVSLDLLRINLLTSYPGIINSIMEKIITWTDDHEKVSDMAYINKLFKDMLYRSETATEAQEALHSLYTILMNNGLKRIRVCDAREDQYDESLLLKKGRMRALEFLKNPNLEASIAALKWYQIINKKENELMTIIKAKTIPTNLDADEEFEPVDGRKKIKTSTLRQDNLLEPSKEDPQCQLKNPGMDIEKSAGKVIVTDLIMLDQIPTSQSPEEMVLIQDKKMNLPFVKSQASDTELQEGLSTKKFTNLIPQSSQMLTIPNIGSNSSTLLKNPSKEESREESQVPSMLDSLKISDDLSNVEILDKTALLKELEDLDILNEVLLLPASEFRHGTTLETGEIGITVDILSVPSESDSYKKEIQIQWVLLHEATYLKKFHCQTYHDNLKTNAVDCFKLRDKTGKTLLEPHFENPASRDAESCYKEGGQSYGEKDLQQVSELRSDDKNMAKDKIAADTQFENAYAREKARRDFAETCFMERRRKEKYY